MQVNIINIIYLFFRLAPFIIVSYFTLQSIFNQDLKGVVYLVGLLVATVITVLIGNILPTQELNTIGVDSKYKKAKCNYLSIGSNDQPLSKLPLSQTVLGYTLGYLSYFIAVNNMETQNISTFVLLSLLIVADMYWTSINACSVGSFILTALAIGGIVGAFWGIIIDSTNVASFKYYSGVSNQDVCSKPSKSLYRCRAISKK
jgi:hypothetical protein